ncbi:hypothetical protein OIDMADRAFT_23052 [Oidiodendron maius Zn]|uniref:Uncharacterized protein n=1 Tax=Oidiodendron maius (strain Zn) TaxID=913774 RepID=A0A0C3HZG1_OIDMZ|nr:hypothetical protein OIDMADRAFT_23052 [Oidiodendron maius Zn]
MPLRPVKSGCTVDRGPDGRQNGCLRVSTENILCSGPRVPQVPARLSFGAALHQAVSGGLCLAWCQCETREGGGSGRSAGATLTRGPPGPGTGGVGEWVEHAPTVAFFTLDLTAIVGAALTDAAPQSLISCPYGRRTETVYPGTGAPQQPPGAPRHLDIMMMGHYAILSSSLPYALLNRPYSHTDFRRFQVTLPSRAFPLQAWAELHRAFPLWAASALAPTTRTSTRRTFGSPTTAVVQSIRALMKPIQTYPIFAVTGT